MSPDRTVLIQMYYNKKDTKAKVERKTFKDRGSGYIA